MNAGVFSLRGPSGEGDVASTKGRTVSQVLTATLRSRLLGQILLRQGAITEVQLQEALAVQKENHKLLGEILIDLGYITRSQLREALRRQQNHWVDSWDDGRHDD